MQYERGNCARHLYRPMQTGGVARGESHHYAGNQKREHHGSSKDSTPGGEMAVIQRLQFPLVVSRLTDKPTPTRLRWA